MLHVAIETSHRQASIALRHGDEVLASALDPERAHASDCLPVLAGWFEERGLSARAIDAVFVGTGPGSYTGLRIGVATALGLARGADAALRGEASGEALAGRELAPGRTGVHLLDARQQELYYAHYRRTETGVEVLAPPCVLRYEQLAEQLDGDALIFGDAHALELAGLAESVGERFRATPPPDATSLLELGAARLGALGPQPFDQVLPLYLRPFAAKVRRR